MRVGVIMWAVVLGSTPAFAHAMLEHATPGAGASVKAPEAVVLQYSEALEPSLSQVTVSDNGGHDVSAGTPSISGTIMQVKLKPLRPGTYHVTWRALSVDTHRTSGAYSFDVVP
jgi:methionine-rich copper-binding protein CopC